MNKKLLLNKANLDIKRFSAKSKGKYALDNIRITSDFVEATNGHILVRVEYPNEEIEKYPKLPNQGKELKNNSYLIPREAIEKVKIPNCTLNILNHALVGQDEEGKNLIISTYDLENNNNIVVKIQEDDYPEIDNLMDDKVGYKIVFALNAELLKELADFIAKHSKKDEAKPIIFYYKNAHSPIYFASKTKDKQKVEGAIMPMDLDSALTKLKE